MFFELLLIRNQFTLVRDTAHTRGGFKKGVVKYTTVVGWVTRESRPAKFCRRTPLLLLLLLLLCGVMRTTHGVIGVSA